MGLKKKLCEKSFISESAHTMKHELLCTRAPTRYEVRYNRTHIVTRIYNLLHGAARHTGT